MKKIISFFLCAITVLIIPVCAFAQSNDEFTQEQKDYYKNLGLQGTVVNVYNWGEYISDGAEGSMDVVSEFEKLTGAKVNYSNFESNENMYSKLSGGGVSYDVITPSDYMVSRLIDEDMLLELDYDNIPNFKYVRDDCKNLYFDPEQKYSICFNTGTTILIYNKNLVDEEPTSWDVLWDEKYKDNILMFNNSRDAFAIAHAMLGNDFNSTNEKDWTEAAQLLAKQKDTVSPVYVMDEVFNLMESGEYAFATYYAGDYLLMNDNNEDLGYCFPKEGVNEFYDAFCIPKCSQNKKGAEAFINFMQEPQVAYHNQEYIYYASANLLAQNNPDSSLYASEVAYPENIVTQNFDNLPQNILELENNLWSRVKSGRMSVNNKKQEKVIYTISASIGVLIVVALGFYAANKIKKNKEQDLSDLY